jgi:hypothetical protein
VNDVVRAVCSVNYKEDPVNFDEIKSLGRVLKRNWMAFYGTTESAQEKRLPEGFTVLCSDGAVALVPPDGIDLGDDGYDLQEHLEESAQYAKEEAGNDFVAIVDIPRHILRAVLQSGPDPVVNDDPRPKPQCYARATLPEKEASGNDFWDNAGKSFDRD